MLKNNFALFYLPLLLLTTCGGVQLDSKRSSFVSVRDFGAKGDGVNDDFSAISDAVSFALLNKLNVYLPSGKYLISAYFPIRNVDNSYLRSYNNIHVFGDGKKTLIFTKTANCSDVFQLNAVSEVTIRNLKITSLCENSKPTQGSNGISITNGGENITIKNVFIENLPYTKKPDYFDGGKGITIQPGKSTNYLHNILIEDSKVENCVYGFGIDLSGEFVNGKRINNVIFRNSTVINCWRGISIGTTETMQPSKNNNEEKLFVIEGNRIDKCSTGIFIGRLSSSLIKGNDISTNELTSNQWSNDGGTPIDARGLYNSKIYENRIKCKGCKKGISSIEAKLSGGRVFKMNNIIEKNIIKCKNCQEK
jgi:polygalacturonase